MNAPEVRTPGGYRASAEDTETDAAIVAEAGAERKAKADAGRIDRAGLAGIKAHHHSTVPGLAASERRQDTDAVDVAPLGTAAARALVTPTSEKDPDVADAGGPVQTETKRLTFEHPANDGKRFATLRAVASLHGIPVYKLADGGYLVRMGAGWVREVPDLRSLVEMLRRMGVQS